MPPRDGLREPFRGYPAVGAVHPIAANKQLRDTLDAIADIADEVFDPHDTFDPRSMEEKVRDGDFYDSAKFYRLFDAQTLGLSILEMDIPSRIAERTKTVWQRNDLGAVKQDIEHEAARHLPDDTQLKLCVNSVISVGGHLPMSREPLRSKLAFNFDPSKHGDVMHLILEEHAVAKRAVESRLHKKRDQRVPMPIDFVPHVTFMAYKKQVDLRKIAEINRQVGEMLREKPLTLHLGQLTTERSRLVR